MSPLLLVGWLLAVAAASLLLLARRAARRSTERVVRACHELRGPLQNVMLALAADGPDGGRHALAPGTASAFAPASGTASAPALAPALAVELLRASRAVEDLSALAAGGRARDEERLIALDPLVRELVAVHDLAARARGRRVVLGELVADAVVRGDRARLVQAIGNLVRNAVEHGEGTVRVGLGCGPGSVHVEVSDEGRGLRMPIDALVRSAARGQRGRGMRIVAEALAAHGGRLRSAPSAHGARLVAELPAVARPPRAALR